MTTMPSSAFLALAGRGTGGGRCGLFAMSSPPPRSLAVLAVCRTDGSCHEPRRGRNRQASHPSATTARHASSRRMIRLHEPHGSLESPPILPVAPRLDHAQRRVFEGDGAVLFAHDVAGANEAAVGPAVAAAGLDDLAF